MKVSGASKSKAGEAAPMSPHGRSPGSTAVSRTDSAQATFSEVVVDMEARQLLEELDDIGAQLSRYPTSVLIGRYRDLVKMALEKARDGMQVKREFKWRRTERSMFLTIERTESALDELDDALMREGDRVRALSLLDEIKGCLISLIF
jgi:uncharacterized protein YaaR (DUF327 family)